MINFSRSSSSKQFWKLSFQSYDKEFQSFNKTKQLRKKPSELVSDKDVMLAILLLTGPACTLGALNNNGPKDYRKRIKDVHFRTAAAMLQQANLGVTAELTHGGTNAKFTSLVFIKKPPAEMQKQHYEQLKEFCTVEKYTMNYYKRPPANILQKWRQKLTDLGLVPADHFKGALDNFNIVPSGFFPQE